MNRTVEMERVRSEQYQGDHWFVVRVLEGRAVLRESALLPEDKASRLFTEWHKFYVEGTVPV